MTIATQSYSPFRLSRLTSFKTDQSHGILCTTQNGQAKPHENLYYTSSKIVGCRRDGPLGITPGTAGVIQLPRPVAIKATQ